MASECNSCEEKQFSKGTRQTFLKAVTVWINKPHVVNRRLCGSTLGPVYRCQTYTEKEQRVEEIRQMFFKEDWKLSWPTDPLFKDLAEEVSPYIVIAREIIPKSDYFPTLYEAIVYDKAKCETKFIPVHQSKGENVKSTKEVMYSFSFQELTNLECGHEVILTWACESESSQNEIPQYQTSPQWLRSVLLTKLINWSQVHDISTGVTSLQLVSVDKYKEVYSRLKNTYGRDLVKNWTESTDPEKFVYEDVAIAAYLLLIWEDDRVKKGLLEKQSFVDLGCGNGLLVYILSMEGHKGLGIDLRKRKIWDTFGQGVDLREQVISPSSENLFPDYDWLIGNHSDELTPWIPVIAARSSYDCCFFVLPCCHHDFVGKFGESRKGQSRYGTYVDYIHTVVEECGFHPETDTLRIPSTKRICLIGRRRSYKLEDEKNADSKRQAFINKRANLYKHRRTEDNEERFEGVVHENQVPESFPSHEKAVPGNVSSQEGRKDAWADDFKPRVEVANKNCQAVAEETKQKIVNAVFERVMHSSDCETVELTNGRQWRKGGTASLPEVAAMFDQDTLQELKCNCGGLQTLLRNHSHIFQVSGKHVRLRDFSIADPWKGSNPHKRKTAKGRAGSERDTKKTSLCWFYKHHPDGCPRDSETCNFAHGEAELRPKPAKHGKLIT